jgi:hypothetical protein
MQPYGRFFLIQRAASALVARASIFPCAECRDNPVGRCGRAASRVCGVALLIDAVVAARQINTERRRRSVGGAGWHGWVVRGAGGSHRPASQTKAIATAPIGSIRTAVILCIFLAGTIACRSTMAMATDLIPAASRRWQRSAAPHLC